VIELPEFFMEECLKRMYFISLNLLDELADKNNKAKIVEIRETMTKFYYLLVMQVRRFLSEGKFTKENQIPLIRAMDIRMVAERIQRIGEIISSIGELGKDFSKVIKNVREYYTKAFQSFISNNFEKALPLWIEEGSIQKGYTKMKRVAAKTKNIALHQKTVNLLQILRYSKEISMLIR
jgi:phosphate uptake regulator